MFYKKVLAILILIVLCCCKRKKLSNHPFYVTKNITCNDLYENGYRWLPGVDVTLLGKKNKDTTIHYQVHQDIEYEEFIDIEEETILMDTVKSKEVHKYQKYLDQDPLVLSDSIYSLVWGDLKNQQKSICKNSVVHWRNCIITIKETETEHFINNIDTLKYKVINQTEKATTYYIKRFQVINLFEKDTFSCSIYKNDHKFYFSSSIKIKNK